MRIFIQFQFGEHPLKNFSIFIQNSVVMKGKDRLTIISISDERKLKINDIKYNM